MSQTNRHQESTDEPREFALPPSDAPERGQVPMPRPVGTPEPGAAGAGAWILAWGEFVLLAILADCRRVFRQRQCQPRRLRLRHDPDAWRRSRSRFCG